jgi:hypothetical protein
VETIPFWAPQQVRYAKGFEVGGGMVGAVYAQLVAGIQIRYAVCEAFCIQF